MTRSSKCELAFIWLAISAFPDAVLPRSQTLFGSVSAMQAPFATVHQLVEHTTLPSPGPSGNRVPLQLRSQTEFGNEENADGSLLTPHFHVNNWDL